MKKPPLQNLKEGLRFPADPVDPVRVRRSVGPPRLLERDGLIPLELSPELKLIGLNGETHLFIVLPTIFKLV